MDELRPAGALDVIEMLRRERAAFVALLESLDGAAWEAPTECPAWTVKGVALHVLGDDFSLLSRQRDAATDSLTLMLDEEPEWDFRQRLNAFNERWVHRASFMSPRLVIELLEQTDGPTADFYAQVDPELRGEPVPFVGPEPAPYWMIAGREYLERWVHHHQIARASGRPGPSSEDFVVPAVAAVMRGFPGAMAAFDVPAGSQVSIVLGGAAAWTLAETGGRWALFDGRASAPTVCLELTLELATGIFSRALTAAEVTASVATSGDQHLASVLTAGVAAFFGRE